MCDGNEWATAYPSTPSTSHATHGPANTDLYETRLAIVTPCHHESHGCGATPLGPSQKGNSPDPLPSDLPASISATLPPQAQSPVPTVMTSLTPLPPHKHVCVQAHRLHRWSSTAASRLRELLRPPARCPPDSRHTLVGKRNGASSAPPFPPHPRTGTPPSAASHTADAADPIRACAPGAHPSSDHSTPPPVPPTHPRALPCAAHPPARSVTLLTLLAPPAWLSRQQPAASAAAARPSAFSAPTPRGGTLLPLYYDHESLEQHSRCVATPCRVLFVMHPTRQPRRVVDPCWLRVRDWAGGPRHRVREAR